MAAVRAAQQMCVTVQVDEQMGGPAEPTAVPQCNGDSRDGVGAGGFHLVRLAYGVV